MAPCVSHCVVSTALWRRHRPLPRWLLPLLAAVAALAKAVKADASALNATQGTWFSYSATASLYLGNACGGGALASVSDPQTCTPVTINYNGQSAYVAFQASCDDSGSSVSYTACFNTQTCSGNCRSQSVTSGTCVTGLLLYGQPASAKISCATGAPTPLFLGVLTSGCFLVALGASLFCCAARIRRACAGRAAAADASSGYLQLGSPGGGAHKAAALRAVLTAKFCATCGARVDAAFCPRCGARAPADAAESA